MLQAVKRGIIDRLVWLAGLSDAAAQILIEPGKGTGAPDQFVTTFHHDIRVGADHQQTACGKGLELVPVVIWSFGLVIKEASAADQIGICLAHNLKAGAVIEAEVAFRADVEALALGAAGQQVARHVAGRDDVIVGVARHAKHSQLLVDRLGRARSIGDEHDRATLLLAEAGQRLMSGRKGGYTIVQYAPDIAENAPVVRRNGAKAGDEQGAVAFMGASSGLIW